MRPRFRFTLSSSFSGSKVISEPDGWQKIEFSLERHPEYHSLVESFEIPLIFYGRDGANDGGYDWIKADMLNGLNHQVGILIEIQTKANGAYSTCFDGLLAISDYLDQPRESKIQIPVVRNDLWAKFTNRRGMKIDMKSPLSVDGDPVTVRDHRDSLLTGQRIRQTYSGENDLDVTISVDGTNTYGVLDFGRVIQEEIETKYNYPRVASPTRPFELFMMKYAGNYQVNSVVWITDNDPSGQSQVNDVELYIQINDQTPIAFTKTQHGTSPFTGATRFEYSDTHALNATDFIRFYFINSSGGANPFVLMTAHNPGSGSEKTTLEVLGDTELPQSTAESFLIHDAGLSIVDRIIGRDEAFYSEFFGGGDTAIPYEADGCGYPFILTKGLHVRGYSIAEKPFSLSFDEWWSGAHPIFGLGLGYENLENSPDAEVIRVEEMEAFYDGSASSVTLSKVDAPEAFFDTDLLLKSFNNGYSKWSVGSKSGLDDPQTKHWYSQPLITGGNDDDKLSTYYAAALGIEETRRKNILGTQDWELDEDVMIIHMDMTATPEQPRLFDASPASISNLLNSDTRYNLKLTPYANLYRWRKYLGMLTYDMGTTGFDFMRGEGNIDMTFSDSGDGCDLPIEWTESDDFPSSHGILHSLTGWRFEHKLTWEQYTTIRANRKKGITFTYYDKNEELQTVECFIKKILYRINDSMAKFELWDQATAAERDHSDDFSSDFS